MFEDEEENCKIQQKYGSVPTVVRKGNKLEYKRLRMILKKKNLKYLLILKRKKCIEHERYLNLERNV